MQLMHFHTLRSGIQLNASPASGRTLVLREGALRQALTSCGIFDTVEVEHTDDPDRLLVSLCQYRPNLTEEQVAAALDDLWRSEVQFPFWEAHSTNVYDGQVEFEGATRMGPMGAYVTVHLVAQASPVPAQRLPR